VDCDVTALYHFEQGKKWLDTARKSHSTSALAYCAFEFRIALERVAFELLLQIRGSKRKYGACPPSDSMTLLVR